MQDIFSSGAVTRATTGANSQMTAFRSTGARCWLPGKCVFGHHGGF